MSDFIDRQTALDGLKHEMKYGAVIDQCGLDTAYDIIENIPSVEPNNQVHLCDFCKYNYPECLTEGSDVIFGNGMGHDNICACTKFEIKQERTAKVKSKSYYGTTTNTVGYFTCIGKCGNCDCEVNEHYVYCPVCGARLEWK